MTGAGWLGPQALALVAQEQNSWPQLAEALAAFQASVVARHMTLGGRCLVVQHNPGRYGSVSARVDPDAVAARRCFLCAASRPVEQGALEFDGEYEVLCNPFPILPQHLTIVHCRHQPQEIRQSLPDFSALTWALGAGWAVLYNGPCCGASAPDHLHFQAGAWDHLPLRCWLCDPAPDQRVSLVMGTWACIRVRDKDQAGLTEQVRIVLEALAGGQSEPLVSLVGTYLNGWGEVFIFPRQAHRPQCYAAAAEGGLLISPGAVDMAGLVIVPRPQDFERVTAADLEEIFAEVGVDQERATGLLAEAGLLSGAGMV